ncbi:M48 family metallopeptidase [Rheinheimera tangshanensis]|jgi:Zn-dependent protease with chaperone function|uniref:M48 family metallopeptidase n=1 Tax=Rheinheimera tangshanensis TaxID=400153 RepID=A0A5C8M2B0_9GAMM|nr:M48 family metallopeptidase [Rheinheimera tangshanensis]TXK81520.1 M48 family metallopeptidase [Rheinheimera tangshanensis]GGM57377.1 Zn-dependent protease [Rheinheimera tangshanensis]
MASNFFAAQDQARSNTKLLVLLFTLAVITLLILTNLLVMVTLGVMEPEQYQLLLSPQHPDWFNQLPWHMMGWVSLLVFAVIAVVVSIKRAELSQGGQVVAKALGGRLVDYQLADNKQQRLLNIVEEMAIAAGVPVPPVYLMNESSINAFAAGYSPADAVIGVTQGCLNLLNRDQLQGVIAHEFSHILNGDMRLNIRLIALLHGIEFIGHSGYFLLRSMGRHRAVGAGSSKSKDNGGGILGLALGLMVLGYLGTFFGSLIKAAVSRQREFLADASAVQFTRNPSGIAGALKSIGAATFGSQVKNPNADEMSHLFFAEAISRWSSLFATHPPLQQRIKRLDPSWDGVFPTETQLKQQSSEQSSATVQIGHRQSAAVLSVLPAFLLETSRHALSAPALCCACLLQTEHLEKQWAMVKAHGDPQLLQNIDRLYDEVSRLSGRQKLQLIQIAVPALKQLSQQQFVEFQTLCQNLSRCDGQEDLLEWTILNWLQHCVGSQFNPSLLHRRDRSSNLAQVQQSVLALLSLCAQQAKDEKLQQQAWSSGLQLLALPSATARPAMSLSQLTEQLPALIHSTPRLKQQLWQMLKIAVQADQLVNDQEAMLLQALALLLEIPVGPDQSVA